jgi:spermidine synthase
MLVLDNAVQTTEKDEFVYHEMLAYVPLLTHPNPKQVAIIGGGDGGSLRRVLHFPSVERAYQIELDRAVTETCLQYMPSISAGAFDDPRSQALFDDGAKFLAETDHKLDVVLVDSTDPIGAAEVLFSDKFYRDAYHALNEDGILVTQSGSPLLMAEELSRAVANIRKVFPLVRVYLASIPGYPGVLWSFTLASKGLDPLTVPNEVLATRLGESKAEPLYYTPEMHRACFALPPFLAARIEGQISGPFTL